MMLDLRHVGIRCVFRCCCFAPRQCLPHILHTLSVALSLVDHTHMDYLKRVRSHNNDHDNRDYSSTMIVVGGVVVVPENNNRQSHRRVLDDDDESFELDPSRMRRWTIRHQVSRQLDARELV